MGCKTNKDGERRVGRNGGSEVRKGGKKEGEGKKKLKGGIVLITKDFTWKERRMKWKMMEIAKRRRGERE